MKCNEKMALCDWLVQKPVTPKMDIYFIFPSNKQQYSPSIPKVHEDLCVCVFVCPITNTNLILSHFSSHELFGRTHAHHTLNRMNKSWWNKYRYNAKWVNNRLEHTIQVKTKKTRKVVNNCGNYQCVFLQRTAFQMASVQVNRYITASDRSIITWTYHNSNPVIQMSQ